MTVVTTIEYMMLLRVDEAMHRQMERIDIVPRGWFRVAEEQGRVRVRTFLPQWDATSGPRAWWDTQ